MSMAIPREPKKTLTEMSLPELQDLLKRQERLVANNAFVNKLPDKGEKMMGLIERLKTAIRTHQQVDETADLFQQLALNAETARKRTTVEQEEHTIFNAIVNQPVQEKVLIDGRQGDHANESEDDVYFPETYKRVIKTPNKGEIVTERFIPNRIPQKLTKEKKIQPNTPPKSTPDTKIAGSMMVQEATNSSSEGTVSDGTQAPRRRLRHRYDDSLEEDMRGTPGIHERTKMISIEESVNLLNVQKKHQEEVQTKQAMDRLAQRLGIKVDNASFDPEGSRKMAYRVTEDIDSDDNDSDDDTQEKDYPDEPSSDATATSSTRSLRHSTLGSAKNQPVVK